MKLTVLGNNGPYPEPGGACSGYLIEVEDKKILLDCGNGVLGNLQKFIKFEELDMVILTHLHSDHMSDMMVLRYAVMVKKMRKLINKVIDVFAPREPAEDYNKLDIRGCFNLKPIDEELALNYGGLNITFKEMNHPVETYAVSLSYKDRRFIYSGDTAWCKNIIEFCKDADCIMLDSGTFNKDKNNNSEPHMTPEECGRVAKEANVKRLLLTHFWPDDDKNACLDKAKEFFGSTECTELFKTYTI